MDGKFLLDTNAVIDLMDQGDPRGERLSEQQVWIPSIVFGELYFRAYKSNQTKENLERLEALARAISVLPCDLRTASVFGKIKQALQSTGRPIPDNDIWIAAVAIQHDLTLVTRDAHFQHVSGLNLAIW